MKREERREEEVNGRGGLVKEVGKYKGVWIKGVQRSCVEKRKYLGWKEIKGEGLDTDSLGLGKGEGRKWNLKG